MRLALAAMLIGACAAAQAGGSDELHAFLDGAKERDQVFEGDVIARQNAGAAEMRPRR